MGQPRWLALNPERAEDNMSVVRKVWKDKTGIHEFLSAEWVDMDALVAGEHLPVDAEGKVVETNKTVYDATKGMIGKNYGADWYGGIKDWKDVTRFINEGWEAGVAKVKPLVDDLSLQVTGRVESIKPFWRNDEAGSVHRWERDLEGDHDVAWRRRVRRKTTGHNVISLGVQFGGLVEVTPAQYFWCGAQMVAAVQLLEDAGFEVEARAYVLSHFSSYTTDDKGTQVFEVLGKRAGDAPNLNNLMALCGHIGVYRTLGFLGFASSAANMSSGFGRDVTQLQDVMLKRYQQDAPMDAYDVSMPLAYSRADAIKNITACLAKVGEVAGVTIFENARGY